MVTSEQKLSRKMRNFAKKNFVIRKLFREILRFSAKMNFAKGSKNDVEFREKKKMQQFYKKNLNIRFFALMCFAEIFRIFFYKRNAKNAKFARNNFSVLLETQEATVYSSNCL